ncbi:dephospho-CoA kinase [Bacillus luteolus]|uniref:Dephospho-CoA kinase n=1 Tax=Litchfieldia luteola TaxID=682179 RepID=A0ABR9QIB3_9BACI|nr:dephospho-CoA kinase [Cytobacillus luteolus]MBE4908233.1 dephospho-CoA kinase [Cytobacillus luteolus]MBP1943019.1 dephospho-CoA kinase [Cytobacillus luteolus]
MALIIGLTGGIASGKSTVSKMLEELGLAIVDADKIAHQVVEVGKPAYTEIVRVFGEKVLKPDLSINRPELGAIIFNDKQKREMLNSIVHPEVRKEMLQQADRFIKNGAKAVILDIPLLFESKLTHMVQKTILVYVDEEVQLERLMSRNGYTEAEAKARIFSQMPLIEKKDLADVVLDNNGSINNTREQLLLILSKWDIL